MDKLNAFHHGDLKRELYDVAVSLLDQHGVSGVTIRAVARSAGVSHSAPVNHYKDRRALLTAIAQGQFETILKEIETALLKAPTEPKDRIKVFANTIMDFGFRYPHRYQLLWRADLIDHEDPSLLVVMDKVYDKLCYEIEHTVPKANVDKDTVAVALWSMVHGYVDMRLSGMFSPLNDKVIDKPRRDAMLELFLTVLR
ncbi:MAG: TetR/AcrR family transcriptional regulator [Kordiimonadaceae bacterium]|nr:TetR/AcrR family transcriptional regulator [Kordiimonadaceae bacterium]